MRRSPTRTTYRSARPGSVANSSRRWGVPSARWSASAVHSGRRVSLGESDMRGGLLGGLAPQGDGVHLVRVEASQLLGDEFGGGADLQREGAGGLARQGQRGQRALGAVDDDLAVRGAQADGRDDRTGGDHAVDL